MKRFGISANLKKDPGLEITKKIIKTLDDRKAEYAFDEITAAAIGSKNVMDYNYIDVLLVLGGDGTVLHAARKAAPFGVEILGVNLGRLGFLIDTEPEGYEKAIDRILLGDYFLEERMMLEANVYSNEKLKEDIELIALNEVVVSQRQILRMVNLEVCVNGNTVYDMNCDGVIVSTPTGSTGYSLSAGGPILMPTLESMVLTPVCAHVVKARSIVISGDDTVEIKQKSSSLQCVLFFDGQTCFDIELEDTVVVKKSKHHAKFIKFKENDFFKLLNKKLIEW